VRGRHQRPAAALALAAALAVAGCAQRPAPPPSLELDPLEEQNREAHALNKTFDSYAYGPVSRAYGAVLPEPARNGVTNLVQHVSLPAVAVQNVLQNQPLDLAETTLRFAINTVFGLGGLLDPAAEMGLPYDEANMDETLHVWGVPSGAYLELPVGGPGTQRDWAGYGLDIAADPLFYILAGPYALGVAAVRTVDLLHDRYKLDAALDSLLYESSDSYTALRISYLQNARARLQGGTDVEDLEDPYADF
jgi:phospholipid-binding lipoprotein MlaA